MQAPYVNKLLQIIVQVSQILLSALVVGNELLLALEELLTLVLESLPDLSLVVDARKHERVLVVFGVFGELGEEFVHGY